MPDFGASVNSAQAPAAGELTEMLRNKRRQPVDSKGKPLPIRKSGYDALDKNSFLKLLVTQLAKQDPTNPMNDREFISQMAQFSSLEQMNNVANSMNKLRASQANQLIGKMVQGKDFVTEKPVQGIVTKATFDHSGEVFLSVNGRQIKLDDITEVTQVTPIEAPTLTPSPSPGGRGEQEVRAGNVSRETLPPGATLTPPTASPLPPGEGSGVRVSPSQAAKAYEANQKAAPTPVAAPKAAATPAAAPAAGAQPHVQKINVPKGE